ncbi:MAG: peptidase M24 [Cyclobacteriaceae bacterium]|nr:MAG: peptidase M24 [Cyclobacteriaceae bacterium]
MRKLFWLAGLVLISLLAFHFYPGEGEEIPMVNTSLIEEVQPPPDSTQAEEATAPAVIYGINLTRRLVIENKVKPNENLSSILSNYQVPFQEIDQLARKAEGVFDVRKINAHRNYKLICTEDSVAQFMIYEPNKIDYVVFDLNDSVNVYKGSKAVDTVETAITGTITTSLYEAMIEDGASPQLVDYVADIFGWQLDFTRLQKGDRYKIIYQQQMVEGELAEVGPVIGAEFIHEENPFYAVRFNQGNGPDYFDEKGHSLRKAFLKYPVKFTRISSRYSGKRFHPVLKRYRSHLGTDYAAPRGTPIRAAGDGIVTEARYHKGNGNYVKIRHNATYTTQYLHMSRIGKGVKSGAKVTQGQTIGYVGSTGLANGPHLCYRFWKNGKQVDAMKVSLPPSEPITMENKTSYDSVMIDMIDRLHQIEAQKDIYPVLAGE